MIKRTIEIGNPSQLSVKHQQLVVTQNHQVVGKVPIEDIGMVVLDHPAINLSKATLVALQEAKAVTVVCDAKHMPQALVTPISGHSLHAKILKEQINWRLPMKKRAWQQLIIAKIKAQQGVLAYAGRPHTQLAGLWKRVRSGDPDNVEAHAARIYWQSLFGPTFRRDPESEGRNALLNYGYAILRAGLARAISAAGLHPALALFHTNQYNAFALADDLLEPFRPIVDAAVFDLSKVQVPPLDRISRPSLLALLAKPVTHTERRMPLMSSFHHLVTSLRAMGRGESNRLEVASYDFRRISDDVVDCDV